LTIDDHSNERPVLLTTGFFRNVKSPAAVVQHADPETLMPEPRFLTDVALAIPLVHELWLNWRAILAEIDAFTTRFNDPFVEYPRYRIRDGGPFLYENEWKVLPTTIIDGEALDATIDSPIGATDLPPLNGTASRERIWGWSKPREATNATRKEGTG